jgi:hypothetical protein
VGAEMEHRTKLEEGLGLIFQGIGKLKEQFPEKAFTVDGRLVGDVGEVIAALEYVIDLYEVQTPVHDGETSDGRKVQIKATFKDKLSLTAVPEFYLGIRLFEDGTHEEIFNGPGSVIAERFSHRSGFGEKQLSFPLAALQELSHSVLSDQRIPRRVP